MKAFSLLCLGAIGLTLSGCGSYLLHIAQGQTDLLDRARPIEEVLADPTVDEDVAEKLALVRDARLFSEANDLEVGDSYTSYSDLDRESTVWVVYRAEPLALQAVTKCWPIAGCVPYQGFFKEERADAYYAESVAAGYDSFVGPTDAYATLGWFPDPIASPALTRSKTSLVELVIHESVHNTIYRPGASDFNEGLANTIAYALVKEFWAARGVDPQTLDTFFDERAHARQLFFDLIDGAKQELQGIFADPNLSDTEKRAAKAGAYARLRQEYRRQKPDFGGYNYDGFFERELNNAHMVSVGTYEDTRPLLEAVLNDRFQGDVRAFIAAMHRVAKAEDWRDAIARL